MRFSKVRQLLEDFQLIPAPSLDFQVGLNLDETAPLSTLKSLLTGTRPKSQSMFRGYHIMSSSPKNKPGHDPNLKTRRGIYENYL